MFKELWKNSALGKWLARQAWLGKKCSRDYCRHTRKAHFSYAGFCQGRNPTTKNGLCNCKAFF